MTRWNSDGLPREQLVWALTRKDIVPKYVLIDSCMLCRSKSVNPSGLCRTCYSMLDTNELKLAIRWINGVGP